MQYIDKIDTRFQDLFARFLRDRTNAAATAANTSHLDEDTISAFVDGALTLREMDPVVAHLADCGHCRTSTAALLRLEAEFADVPVAARESSEGSAGLTEALSSWFSKLFGSSAEGVFAHGERSEKDAKKDTAAADDGSDNDDADRT